MEEDGNNEVKCSVTKAIQLSQVLVTFLKKREILEVICKRNISFTEVGRIVDIHMRKNILQSEPDQKQQANLINIKLLFRNYFDWVWVTGQGSKNLKNNT